MTDSVIVGVRVRPLNARENSGGRAAGNGWKVEANSLSKV